MAEQQESQSPADVRPEAQIDSARDVLGAASREKADAYLDEQIVVARAQAEVLRLQAHELKDELRLHHWSSRVRHTSDIMKMTFEVGLALIVIAIAIFAGAAMWNASQAEGLVVDSFVVPPSYAEAGITGTVVADDMTQKIAAIHDFTNGYSLAHSKDVRESREDVKVEIPETGVSISEAWRYLRLWLGNEEHLNGNLRNLPDGRIALTVSLGGADTFTFTGKPGDLDGIEQKAAERIFETIDPVNIVLYLEAKGRTDEVLGQAARDLTLWTDNRNLAEAYSLDADMIHTDTGDVRRALALANLAIALDSRSTPPHMESLNASHDLGHDEDVLAQARAIAGLRQEDNVVSWRTGPGYAYVEELGSINRAGETGDFVSLSVVPCTVYCSLASAALLHSEAFARMHDGAQVAKLIALAQSFEQPNVSELLTTRYADASRARYFIHATTGDWRAAVADARHLIDDILADKDYAARLERLRVQILATPLLAHALAASGDLAAARKAIGATPSDCYGCLRQRANIDVLAHNLGGATYWFARATAAAPSVPFAYADWGAMLLHEGRYDTAIGKFREAERQGPHFADPIEMWGEALMQENRSDLALAKFEEASKYAPNWGRLRLKWGEALLYTGRRGEAAVQLRNASSLDLKDSDRRELGVAGNALRKG
jgi:tetratricopeptide (TPR) repeat protein